ncbi:hypothetical protein [Vibrio harveyi]|uniref:Uncharacterized protein n=1 Tax=Vibrio harveyi TaxID=669 RepID=E5G5G6_VIBHA|nr:hypothetical protein [Vibrio harveyi]EHD1698312.1 hypothetical protein [Vibrio vulnificus]ADQ53892.1 hypothetical protein [Vibrio harveyi]ADQ53988.1 hypothetical protein [Vibrio harveyi]HDM8056997.1 hypothetical protein [Vibrio harveyi]HDM8062810.1 hypothetical protein [Vibrio harveyi]
MAQQNSTLTLSKCQTATNVSPLERESPPKNDFSLVQRKRQRDLKILDRLREIHGLKRKPVRHIRCNPLNYVCTATACIDLNRI